VRKALLIGLIPLLALAGTVTRTLTFDSRDLQFSEANGYDVVQLSDCVTTLDLGKPMLPEAVFNVLVPAGATVTDIRVTPLATQEIPGFFNIHPVQKPVVLSSTETPEFVEPDPAVYSSNQPYPSEILSGFRTGTKSEYRICGFGLRPLAYIPSTGKLTLSRTIQVEISYEEHDVMPKPITEMQLGVFRNDVAGMVINPEDVTAFAPPVRMTYDTDVEYAIITTSGLAPCFDTLVEWRTKKGYNTKVFTTDSISANYPSGRDLQERIRMCIIDQYENHGLIYVLLAGDNAQVPGRRCYGYAVSAGSIPADVYYGDLQWSYDGNHNNVFGEANGDTVDLYYDVYVGRASVDNTTQANTFVTKVLNYEKNPTTDYLKKVLLPYVMLFPSQNYSGKVVNDSVAELSPASWTDDYIANPSTTTPMYNAINEGYHLSHVAAHGNATGFYTYNSRAIYSTSTAGMQTNSTRPIILNTIACIAGNFEASDCVAEAMMNNPSGGAVATIMNSREGLGQPPSTSLSERMDIRFYTYLFADTLEIGMTHAGSKGQFAYLAQVSSAWRWCYWDLNLFGDPNMPIWLDVPDSMTAAHADTITTGAQSFSVTVTSTGSTPVENALVSCYKPGEVMARSLTNAAGLAIITVNPLTVGTLYVTVTAPDKLPVEDTVTVIQGSPEPHVVFLSCFVDDGGNNRLDPGETADLQVWIKNIGSAQATSAEGCLRTASGHISLIDSTSAYGTVEPFDTTYGDNLNLTASGSTPPGTPVQFTLHVTSDQNSWDLPFSLVVGEAPVPRAVVMDHDTGYCKLSVTCLGSIGLTDPPTADGGSGFCYPKNTSSQLYFASFLTGNSEDYLVDRFYSHPTTSGPNTDFVIIDSLHPVIPPGYGGDEHFRCAMSDAGHPSPEGLRVTQHSHQNADSAYDDFVILVYDITNESSGAMDGMYAGIIADFDIGSEPTTNQAASDSTRRLCYMRQSSTDNPSVGVTLLDPPSFANLSAVDHARYVWPESAMTDGIKWRFLNATVSQRNSDRPYDWSVCVSAGPFDLAQGASQRVAFAFLGGTSEANFKENADSTQAWYDLNAGVFEERKPQVRDVTGLTCIPNPFARSVNVKLQLPVAGRVQLQVFDISGRMVADLLNEERVAGRVETTWKPEGLANGVYLLKAELPDGSMNKKLLLLR